jgi:hypothetical protein
MTMTITSGQSRTPAGKSFASGSSMATSALGYDEQVQPNAVGTSLYGYPYYIETTAGNVYSGRIDSRGLLPRILTDGADQYTVYWGDEALAHKDWQ